MTSPYEEHMNLKVAGADRADDDELENDDELEDDDGSEDNVTAARDTDDSSQDETGPQPAAASLPMAMPTAGAVNTQVSAERLSEEWREIQASFVDDPRGAVQMAADAAETVLTTLVTSLRDRQAALGPTANQDTEQLRAALQEYRKFCQGLAEAGRRLATG